MPTYKEAGVDLEKADRLVDRLSRYQQETEEQTGRRLYQEFGDFAASFDLNEYENPVIFSTCDGVGTKFMLQDEYDVLDLAGRDLVAMNVNDILTTGGEPLLFLDYVAMSPLDENTIDQLVSGISQACIESNCLLAGGETAELPGMLSEDQVELAGFCVGAADKNRIESVPTIQSGDVVLGLPSTGFHANGFSLVRQVINENKNKFNSDEIRSLLEPTRIYYDPVRVILDDGICPSGMVHVTGGGIEANLSRVLPESFGAELSLPEWEDPVIKKVLQHVPESEALKTFNMGFGWLFILDPDEAQDVMTELSGAVQLGRVSDDSPVSIEYQGETET